LIDITIDDTFSAQVDHGYMTKLNSFVYFYNTASLSVRKNVRILLGQLFCLWYIRFKLFEKYCQFGL